jgi:hypothetical protein
MHCFLIQIRNNSPFSEGGIKTDPDLDPAKASQIIERDLF